MLDRGVYTSRLQQRIEQEPPLCGPAQSRSEGRQSLPRALANLLSHPFQLLLLWNWKSASLSIILRAPIFIVASARRGFRAMLAALLVESFYCAATAGFYGALIQTLRDAQPLWLTAIFLTVVVPGVFQVFEAYLHWSRGTPHWQIAEAVSIVASALSSLFNWYAMRRGTFLVGAEGKKFGSDLRRFPGLLLTFVTFLPRHFLRKKTHVDEENSEAAQSESRCP